MYGIPTGNWVALRRISDTRAKDPQVMLGLADYLGGTDGYALHCICVI